MLIELYCLSTEHGAAGCYNSTVWCPRDFGGFSSGCAFSIRAYILTLYALTYWHDLNESKGLKFSASVQFLQIGQTSRALKEMRALLRRYPTFTDMRAGLAAALWAEGLEGQAESQW